MKITRKQLDSLIESRVKSLLNEGPDGWDRNALDDVGLMEFFDKIQEVIYEIRNARRGSYCRDCGTTFEELGNYLAQLAESLSTIAEDVILLGGEEEYDDDEDYQDEL